MTATSTSQGTKPTHIGVGVGVFVVRASDSAILVGKRIGSHGAGTYQLPGGHLDPYETFESCATREVLEETGLRVQDPIFLTATNDPMPAEGKHYVTIFMRAHCIDEVPRPAVLEPEKCESWKFVSYEELMKLRPLFTPLLSLEATRKGFSPFAAVPTA
ncbi:hypothetical protein PhCBS80983_g01933 [Powellomyces hirtus]|uniref:Nudix hydrolase domain-containing protein n=1 Tax=Powellomyces hirtus TaxID=109895 RepID=A0A507E8Z2_9FUNG|nr:hypothetical protein PhCBS80983_g01933 [Powellomyces hirtus]